MIIAAQSLDPLSLIRKPHAQVHSHFLLGLFCFFTKAAYKKRRAAKFSNAFRLLANRLESTTVTIYIAPAL
jgi:hypothetical protein